MRTELDTEADVAYIYFKEIGQGEVAQTISLNNSINIDMDKNGVVIGIEIIDASKHLPPSLINTLN